MHITENIYTLNRLIKLFFCHKVCNTQKETSETLKGIYKNDYFAISSVDLATSVYLSVYTRTSFSVFEIKHHSSFNKVTQFKQINVLSIINSLHQLKKDFGGIYFFNGIKSQSFRGIIHCNTHSGWAYKLTLLCAQLRYRRIKVSVITP